MIKKRATTRRKIAAVLAGGLVLGIGAATTLAAWTDSQQATATFTAGSFQLESKTTDSESDWKDNPITGDPPMLTVSTDGMSPGVSGFGFLDVRTTGGTNRSTLGGNVVLNVPTEVEPSDDLMVDALQFRSKALTAGATCNEAALTGATFRSMDVTPDVAVLKQRIDAAGASTVRFCLEVRMRPIGVTDAVQGTTAKMLWTVTGTSS